MEPINILAIGTNTEILPVILRLLNNKPGWQATGASSLTEALAFGSDQKFDLVLIGGGIDNNETLIIKESFIGTPIAIHYGGGSGLLYAEVYQALNIMPE
ncbi:hypothetical protein HDF19_20665 [Mucilaginibacter sp. E4BP6]|uniref:hypothetical protein n=1 Tax=Mucilaginibacter sp. E4BP6 TaxID=2723089 RepID=UPI0015C72E87|nr:hypothetical protein [Mucilaginibacter sp. E4BP6]NYE68231.1 hypothetical protein [Mucilaginibacter sp. E4BP6]